MRKLIGANLARMWKDKVFWICAAAMLAMCVAIALDGCHDANQLREYGDTFTLDEFYFGFAPVLGIVCAVFASLFVGTEHSEGAMRNRLIVGHTRRHIYLSNLAACFVAGLIFLAAALVGGLAGIRTLGVWQMGASQFAVYMLILVFMLAALTALFTLMSMLMTSKSTAAVTSILVSLAMIFVAVYLYSALSQPEMTSGVVMTLDGVEMGDPTPNPLYVGGAMRAVYEMILDFLPAGQGILMASLEIVHPGRELLFSAFIALSTTAVGLALFERKDLK